MLIYPFGGEGGRFLGVGVEMTVINFDLNSFLEGGWGGIGVGVEIFT